MIKRLGDSGKLVESIHNFINPFDVDKKNFYHLSSDMPASKDIQSDLVNAGMLGREAHTQFVAE